MAQESIGTARLDIVVDTTQFDTAIASAKRGTSDMSQAAQADYTKLAAVERRRVDALVNQANTIGMTRKEQILYNAALRGVPTSILDELKTKLAATGTAAAAAGKQLNQYGVSAAQQSAALRGVPAQLTDIVVSLQGGQQPLTVLLQQGGQLKDMFGGIVPAARALGSTIVGLVNPWTVAAGAVALFSTAIVAGKGELPEFTKTLILSGNAVGQTASGLSDLATRIAGVAGARGKAVDALNLIAGSSKIAGQNIEVIGVAAVAMNRVTGKAIADIVQEFEGLRGKPTEAIAALNEQQHFLTLEIYQQIAGLERQGRTQEAAALAQRTYAEAVKQQADDVRQNLGTLETAWDAVKQGASSAWEAMKGVGKAPTFDELTGRLKEVNAELRSLRDNAAGLSDESAAFTGDGGRAARRRARPVENESRRLNAEAAMLQQQRDEAAIVGWQKRREAEKVAAAARLAALGKETETNKQKRDREIAQVKKDAEITGATLEAQNKLIGQINDKYEDPAAKAYTDSAATKLLQQFRDGEAALKAQITSEDKLASWGKKRAEFEQQIADLKGKQVLTADQKSLLSQKDQLRAQLDLNVAAESQLRTKQETAKVEALRTSLASSRDLEGRQYDDQVAALGLGSRSQEELRARQTILRDYQRQMDQFSKARSADQISQGTFQKETNLLREHLDKRLAMQQDYFDKVRGAQGDWTVGATSALQDYADEAANVAGGAKSAFSTFFQGLDAFGTTAITKLKLDFRSLGNVAQGVLADIAKMLVQQNVTGPLVGFLSSAIGSLAGNWTTTSSSNPWSLSSLGLLEGRASGGPTAPGTFYEVNEEGPELYNYRGRTYLMSGSDGGFVTPLTKSAAAAGETAQGPRITINNNGTPQDYSVERLTRDEVVLIARDQVYEQGPQMMESQFGRPGSRGSRAVTKNFKTERSR